jgi:hypothetical protein
MPANARSARRRPLFQLLGLAAAGHEAGGITVLIDFIVRILEGIPAGDVGQEHVAFFEATLVNGEDAAVLRSVIVHEAARAAIGKFFQKRAFEQELAAGATTDALAPPPAKLAGDVPLSQRAVGKAADLAHPVADVFTNTFHSFTFRSAFRAFLPGQTDAVAFSASGPVDRFICATQPPWRHFSFAAMATPDAMLMRRCAQPKGNLCTLLSPGRSSGFLEADRL